MKEIVVLSGAEAHVLEIHRRLNEKCDGLGTAFYADFTSGCSLLSEQPEIAPRFYRGFRRLLLSKWHAGIFYAIAGNRIMVSAVMDLRQNPRTIRRYLDAM